VAPKGTGGSLWSQVSGRKCLRWEAFAKRVGFSRPRNSKEVMDGEMTFDKRTGEEHGDVGRGVTNREI